jgi:uncharacterized protein YfaA (DUF2138 family)
MRVDRRRLRVLNKIGLQEYTLPENGWRQQFEAVPNDGWRSFVAITSKNGGVRYAQAAAWNSRPPLLAYRQRGRSREGAAGQQ